MTAWFWVTMAIGLGIHMFCFAKSRRWAIKGRKNYFDKNIYDEAKEYFINSELYCIYGALAHVIAFIISYTCFIDEYIPSLEVILIAICFMMLGINVLIIIDYKDKVRFGRKLVRELESAGGVFLIIVSICIMVFAGGASITSDNIYNASLSHETIVRHDESEDVMIYTFTNGASGKDNCLIGSENVNGTPMYFYYYRDADGALVKGHVESDEEITKIYDVLKECEEPYLRTAYTVEITTDSSGVEASQNEEVLMTQFWFYVPEGTKPVEF